MADKMADVTLYGMPFSVYVRIVRLALIEKGVDYTLEPVDVFADDMPDSYLALHPFRKMPAFRHGDVVLYEARAITLYIDEAFAGPSLQPDDPLQRARQAQIISIADNYLYRSLVWGIYVETVSRPGEGKSVDEKGLADSIKTAETALPAVEKLFCDGPFVNGKQISRADLHLAPMFDYFLRCDTAPGLMNGRQRLCEWWAAIKQRDSYAMTPFGPPGDATLPPLKL